MDPSVALNVNDVENWSPTERPPAPLTTDRLLDTLADPRRRYVVRRLSEGGAVALERLIDGAAAAEAGVEVESAGEDDREAVRIALHHSHLPKLVDSGVVVLDREAGTVEPGPQLAVTAACLDALERAR